jgi:hypothetical protein
MLFGLRLQETRASHLDALRDGFGQLEVGFGAKFCKQAISATLALPVAGSSGMPC